MRTLSIPHFSQAGNTYRNDCGAACNKMVLSAYGKAQILSISDIHAIMQKRQNTVDAPVSVEVMAATLVDLGLPCSKQEYISIKTLYELLRNQRPSILLIDYGVIQDAGMTTYPVYRGGHYVVLTGMDIVCAAVLDPLQDGTIEWPIDVLLEAMKTDNYNSICITSKMGEPMEQNIGYVTATSLKLREAPNTESRVLAYLKQNDMVVIKEETDGWYFVETYKGSGYVGSKYIRIEEQ